MTHQNIANRDPSIDPRAYAAADRYVQVNKALTDQSFWPVRMFTALNVFLWHLEGFANGQDPVPQMIDVLDRASGLLSQTAASGVCQNQFPNLDTSPENAAAFEKSISSLFSNVWVGLSDDIYFDESYNFTKERFALNNLDAESVFGGKTVVDAGCGSGKYSAAFARFGAKKVIGIDIGEKGLNFAREQAKKVPYGDRIEYQNASLLDIPLPDESVDFLWSNGVIHHTIDYEKCLSEFNRILKKGGEMFLYVDGRFGLYEVLCDAMVAANADLPRPLFQHFMTLLGINSGRIYWLMDCLFAPYERKSRSEVDALLLEHGFGDIRQLTRGIDIDQIEHVTAGRAYADVAYGEAQLRLLARKV